MLQISYYMKHFKILIFLTIIFLPSFSFAQNHILDGSWDQFFWKEDYTPSFTWEFYTHKCSWGNVKCLKWPFIIDIEEDCFYSENFPACIILDISRINENSERYLLFSPITKKFYSELITFISDDIIQIVAEGSNYPSTYYRISGPARIPVQNAVVNTPQVRCLTESSFAGETWGYLNAGDKVLIKDISDEPFEIDGESWYWYRVESESLPDGWVYGKYLNIEE